MRWWTKFLKGSSHKGHYHRRYEDRYRDEPRQSVDDSSGFDKEEIECAIALSLSVEDQKGKKVIEEDTESEQSEEDYQTHQSEEDYQTHKSEEDYQTHQSQEDYQRHQPEEDEKDVNAQSEEDEQLAKAIQESLEPPPQARYDSGNVVPPYAFFFPSSYRICAGCNTEIGQGRFLSCLDSVWHPDCFRCDACNLPISDYEFSMSGNRHYHKSCYRNQHHPKCDVCNNFIPTNSSGLIEYKVHPFWKQKYCPSHERDGTPRCCCCERMEPRDTRYLSLDDGRKLCLECLDSAIVDTLECQPLYFEIREFYEGLNMKVEQEIPLLLVERTALNEAMEGEKNGHHHLPETRGLCLSEEQTVTTVSRRPRMGAEQRSMDIITESYRLSRRCEVTAILILYGLPRLLTGSILAHEMMHAWLRLKGYPNLRPDVEEGICQVLAHMWLDSEIYSSSGNEGASSSSSSSSSPPPSSKKGQQSDFEKKLGEFFKHQIESDESPAYGEGFRVGNQAVLKYGLRTTLDHIRMTGNFPV
ncbi:protein DA1-related 1 [Populus alba]|uniref:LIM zinc-binding domain-containing protein n=3 Tax=Populus TaxID=3689 RepID=A0A4U5PXC9_POPAL|nr:protein DA1-related 1-like [Populus alba]XP_034933115.1 protein DA1-related 1-like [Populus alba]XP_034933116.1 protein DA1-related 1-like [Populus alba]XP_034933117.1 protein DA1-related 1-like [Populus alba]KAG6767991.1 hypothetical protein POTOM_026886 [Populus tomentosa]KAJ6990086.1 protein DA1-related 1-like [Populus alba x Populus x berolinensis]TKS02160.1 hypothetical protein D5086_0000164190 [Populus alba]